MRRMLDTVLMILLQILLFFDTVILWLQRKFETLVAEKSRLQHYSERKLYKQLDMLPRIAGTHTFTTETYKRVFHWLENQGVHITPNHFYYPIPDTQILSQKNIWENESVMAGIDLNIPTQLYFLHDVFPNYLDEYDTIPKQKKPNLKPYEFHFSNDMFDDIDAYVYYAMIRHFQPKTVLEVGSGWSTRLAARAALRNGDTSVISIEPYPEPLLKEGFPGLHSLIEKKVEEVDLSIFQSLGANDILFIDSSHVVRTGGDVNYLYLEVLPRLNTGVVVHIHDIFFPQEYPRWWIMDRLFFWNEQYLLQSFLAFNSAFKIQFANNYMRLKYLDEIKRTFQGCPSYENGQSLWMKKVI